MLYHGLLRSLQGAALIAALLIAATPVPAVAEAEEPLPIDEPAEAPAEMEGEAPADIEDERAETRRSDRQSDADAEPDETVAADAPSPEPAKAPVAEPAKPERLFSGVKPSEKPKSSPLLETRGPDYYDRRAVELLKDETKAGALPPHPLMSAFPGQDVIVCTAGCRDGSNAQIVSMKPRPVPASKPQGQEQSGLITCIGGCPDNRPGTLIAAPAPFAGGSQVAATVGEWMTTVAQVPANEPAPAPQASPAAGSGDWMKTINAERTPAAPAPAKKAETIAAVETPKAPEVPVAQVKAAPNAEAKSQVPAIAEANPAAETPKAAEAPAAPAKAEVKVAAPVETPEAHSKSAPSLFDRSVKVTDTPPAAPAKPAAVAETPKAAEAPAAPAKTEAQAAAPAETPKAEPSLFDKSVKVAAATPLAAEEAARKPEKPAVVSVLSEDKEMNAAIEKARASLHDFWKSYEAPGPGENDFALKVAISGNGSTEHFWLTRIERDGEKLSGLISNQPQSVKTVKMGQRYSFTPDMISDWTFKRNGKLVGNETMRVLLPRMPEEQAAVYREMYETP